jgi:tripartite-type tricarboxylate transporter receptor subunit TctC
MPSGQFWEAYRTLFEMNSRMLRVAALPPGAPPAALAALRTAIERLNNDKEFAAEATRVIEFAPEYKTAADLNAKTRAMLVTTPEMRTYINDYTRNVPKR